MYEDLVDSVENKHFCSAILKRNTIFLTYEIYSLTPKVTPRGMISAKEISSFVNSKTFVIFGSHLENGDRIEKLCNGSIAHVIQ